MAFSLILILLISDCTNNKPVISISGINENNKSKIHLEMDPETLIDNSKLLVARSMQTGDEFILQKTPSLFYSNNEELLTTFSTILPESVSDGEYEIDQLDSESDFTLFEDDSGRLNIMEGDNPVLSYNFGMQLPEGVDERYRRSSYIHPVYDLKGNELTHDFPSDHYHHRGISWMWPKVFVDTTRYDLWHIYGSAGELEGLHQYFEKWLIKETGPICATIGVKNYWALENEERIMDEWVYIRVFKTGETGRAIDLHLTWRALKQVTIIGQTTKGYGGLNFRFAPREETVITGPFGLEEKDSDLENLTWADQSARFGGNDYFSGAAIFQNKNNIDFPAGWCLRYYGFLGVAWPGVDPLELEPGESVTLKFRVWIHRGNAEDGRVEDAYEVYSKPPTITMK